MEKDAAVLSAAPHAGERKDGVAVTTPPGRGGVRADLEQVFRAAYPRVVAVAARVLGSRDEAEDVAQEVFLSFGRSVGAGRRGDRAGCPSPRRTPR